MALTLQQTKRLFQGYPNYDNKVADAVAAAIVNADPANGTYIPYAGSASKFLTGAISVKGGGSLDWYSAASTPVLKAGMTWAADVLYFLDQAGGTQGLNIGGWNNVVVSANNLYLGGAGLKVGFFGTVPVVKQTINATVLADPSGGTVIDIQGRAAIVNLNLVVNSLRTQLQATGLMG